MKLAPSLRIVLVVGALCHGLFAQGEDPDTRDVRTRLTDQEERLRQLEERRAEDDDGWFAGYDRGFVIRSKDMEKRPFSLRINGRMQFRYNLFAVDDDDFVNLENPAGSPLDIDSRSDFEIERGRLEFRGTFWDPRLQFYFNLNADTDDNHVMRFWDFWMSYAFSKSFNLYLGKAFIPGSREWLEGSKATHLADRSMATTFFRPDRTIGIWAIGEPADGVFYRAMIGNGFQTANTTPNQINDDPLLSGSIWFEPNGDFGKGYADIRAEDSTRIRFGSSFTWAKADETSGGSPLPETTVIRLDDGSRITGLGVTEYDLSLLSVDAALKSNGFSLSGELYYRWLNSIMPVGPGPGLFPSRTNRAWGFYVSSGYMITPEAFELVARTSTVQGRFQDSWEYAVGANYYVDGTHSNKLTLDVTLLDGSPASNSGTNLRLGDDGWLVRLQYQIAF